MKLYEMSCNFNFVFEQRDHVCKRKKTSVSQLIATECLQTDKRVSVENFFLHNSAYFDFEVFRKSLVGALICLSSASGGLPPPG